MKRIVKIVKSKWYTISIRYKLILAFMCTACIIFIVNIMMYMNLNGIMNKIDKVYISNVTLSQMSDTLGNIQTSMTSYLNTKSSEALQEYYASEEIYRNLLKNLDTDIVDDEILIIEKNISNLSSYYLTLTGETMQAKRGRNIQKYKQYYEQASEVYDYINEYIYSLNSQQFEYNSVNYKILLDSLSSLEFISTAILVIVIILNIILIYGLTYSITNPLRRLAEVANKVAAGNFNIDLIKVNSLDEVGVVATAFNHMILSIKKYIDQIKTNLETENKMREKELTMESHLKDAQLKYLQAQINPHFLFNTLNAGAQLAMMEGADTTCLFIENMADFFRYNIKKVNEDATLEEEVALVDNYIHILNVRFAGEIHFHKEVDESLLKVRVPSMILQPIVENAVNYGIRDIEWEKVITFRVYEEKEFINISIRDNGVGMTIDKIDQIMEGKAKELNVAKNSNGIGLENVINRLKLYYGCENLLEIVSERKNQGTEVMIHIPKRMR